MPHGGRRQGPAELLLVLLTTAALSAHQPRTEKPAQTGAVSGVTTEGASGRGLSGVVVSLSGGRVSLKTISDSKGRFVFPDLPASNQYYLSAVKSGYIAGGLGKRNSNLLPTPFALAEDEWIPDANIVMWRPGGISGAVVDERGEPLVNIPVRVLTRVPIAGTMQWATGAVAKTDDRGLYRIAGLWPGSYTVSVPSVQSTVPIDTTHAKALGLPATAAQLPRIAGIDVADRWLVVGRYAAPPAAGRQAYAVQFYPNARLPRDAAPVEIAASEEKRNIDFVMRPTSAVRVSGRVAGPPEMVAANLVVRLLLEGGEALGAGSEQATALVASDGTFTLAGVPSGRYVLDVRTGFSELNSASTTGLPATPGLVSEQYLDFLPWLPDLLTTSYRTRYIEGTDGYAARLPLNVGPEDLANVVLTLVRGATINGRIVRDDGRPLPSLVTAKVEPANGDPSLGGQAPDQRAGTDPAGVFTIRGLHEGDYLLRVSAGNLRVKSITGAAGDHTDRPFSVVLGADVTNVVVTLTNKVASVSGAVRNRQGEPVREGVVILFPTDRAQWTRFGREPSRIRSVFYFGTKGYEIPRLAAGEYFIVAVDSSLRDTWQDPRFFPTAAQVATRIMLAWDTSSVHDLVLQQVNLR